MLAKSFPHHQICPESSVSSVAHEKTDRFAAGLRSDVTFPTFPQEERVMGTMEMPLSKCGTHVFWRICGGLQNVPLGLWGEHCGLMASTAALCSSLYFHKATLPVSTSDWLLRDEKIVLWRTQVSVCVLHSACLPFSCPGSFSLSYHSSFDRCLTCQVLFLPYGSLCTQADKLC